MRYPASGIWEKTTLKPRPIQCSYIYVRQIQRHRLQNRQTLTNEAFKGLKDSFDNFSKQEKSSFKNPK